MKRSGPRSPWKSRSVPRGVAVRCVFRLTLLAVFAAWGAAGCSDDSPVTSGPTNVVSEQPVAGSACGAVEREYTLAEPKHVENCRPIEYGSNPPSSGTHYGTWAAFRNYDTPIERGFAVHSMEHGAVVLSYHCDDCDEEVAAVRALIEELGPDPLCCSGTSCANPVSRLILMPDPELDTRFAAASWGFTLRAGCFEPEVFRAFVNAHRGRGPEAVCADGVDVTDPPC